MLKKVTICGIKIPTKCRDTAQGCFYIIKKFKALFPTNEDEIFNLLWIFKIFYNL